MTSVTLQQALERARSLYQSGELEEARRLLEEVVKQAPGTVPALMELGFTRFLQGDMEGARTAYQAALDEEPGHGTAIKSLGIVASRQGRPWEALGYLVEAVKAEPEEDDHWATLASILGGTQDASRIPIETLEPILEGLLQHPAVGSRSLGGTLVSHFRRVPHLGELMALSDAPAVEAELRNLDRWAAFDGKAVRLALTLLVLPDLGWERVLQALRRTLALAAAQGEHPALEDTALLASLAQQSFLSGYVLPYGPDEQAAVEELIMGLTGEPLVATPAVAARVCLLASYVPLVQWERADEVLHLARDVGSPEFGALVKQQIIDPVQEAEIRDQIPVLSTVGDTTSSAVREMYEAHPYPLWTRAPRLRPRTLSDHLRRQLGPVSLPELDAVQEPRILIAGCGTGLHPIQTRMAIQDADFIALDLSLSSLAYAARKAAELSIDRLGFVHGDILAVADWGERFHVVESVGVLHHMADPVAGWRALLSCLEPGGVMRIGLYSEIARRGVVAVRAELAEAVQAAEDEDVRDVRQRVIGFLEEKGDLPEVFLWQDMYSLQEFRDLMLHPQEHRFTLPQLAEILAELELDFLGFTSLPPGAEAAFRSRHPDPEAARDLELWHAFEVERPGTFAGMYQFWVKPKS